MSDRDLSQLIADMNFEMLTFQTKLTKYTEEINATSKNMRGNIYAAIDQMETFLNNKPALFESKQYVDYPHESIKKMFYCDLCEIPLKDSIVSVRKHLESAKHHLRSKRRTMRTRKIIARKERINKAQCNGYLPRDAINFLSEPQLMRYVDYALETSSAITRQIPNKEIDEFKAWIRQTYPHVAVRSFGSRTTGLALSDSDLDLHFGSNLGYKLLSTLIITHNESTWKALKLSLDKHSVLRLVNLNYDINCHLNMIYLHTSLFEHFLCDVQPMFRKLCLVVKEWRRLVFKSGLRQKFTSHSFVLLVIFFLQSHDLLPPIAEFYAHRETPIKYFDNFANSAQVCTELFIKFLKFYHGFRFDLYVISVHLGLALPKATFRQTFPNLAAKITKSLRNRYLDCDKMVISEVAIQDIIEFDVNVAARQSIFVLKTHLRKSLNALGFNLQC